MDRISRSLRHCVEAIEAIHRQIEPYAEATENLERTVSLRVAAGQAKELYDAYHAAVNVATPDSGVVMSKTELDYADLVTLSLIWDEFGTEQRVLAETRKRICQWLELTEGK